MYINEPANPTPIAISGALKAVIYVGLAGTLLVGIWPKPFMEFTVAATTIFEHMEGAPVATLLP
jgi:NADH-quinone oxidoreductase subunit N